MKIISLILLIALVGCSTIETHNNAASFSVFKEMGPYTIKIRAPNGPLSHYTYQIALLKFGQVLDISEKNYSGGSIEITFTSQTQSGFIASSSTSGSSNTYGNAWYTGNNSVGYSSRTNSNSSTITSGGSFNWQNSNMLVTIKDKNGKRLWSADYTYKGGWEMSGFVVNTPSEAAKLSIKRLVKRFKLDNKI